MFGWLKKKEIEKKSSDDMFDMERNLQLLNNEHKLLQEKLKAVKYSNSEKFLDTYFSKFDGAYSFSLEDFVYRGFFNEDLHYFKNEFVFFDNAFWFLSNKDVQPGSWNSNAWNLCVKINS